MKVIQTGLIISIVLMCSHLAISQPYSGGDGSSEHPYQIASVNDFLELTNDPNNWDKSFALVSEIDFEGAELTPVGNSDTHFTGVFDGGGYVLKNLVINQPNVSVVGLFGFLSTGGTIQNLGLKNVEIAGNSSVGGLVGSNGDPSKVGGTIVNSFVTGTVTGGNLVGGLCGFNNGTISQSYAACEVYSGGYAGGLCAINRNMIRQSYATGNVVGSYAIGGLIGRNNSSFPIIYCYASGNVILSGTVIHSRAGGLIGQNYSSEIRFCYAEGNVAATGYSDHPEVSIGGLVGNNGGDMPYSPGGRITFCYAYGNVSGNINNVGGLVGKNGRLYNIGNKIGHSHASGNVSGSSNVGGLIGYNYGNIEFSYAMGDVAGYEHIGGLVGNSYYGSADNCFSVGSVSGVNRIGGLIGNLQRITVTDCYAVGSVDGTDDVGGLVGYGLWGTLKSCYAAGSVNGTGSNIGGFFGRHSGTIADSFWDTETSGMDSGVGSGSSTGVVGKTTNEMQTLSTFTDAEWNFSQTDGTPAIWKMPLEPGYPKLFWQPVFIEPSYTGGSGKAEDPYQIATVADFQHLSIASGDWSKSFIMTADIDLSGIEFTEAPIAPDMDSINNSFQGVAFTGVFDGNGHVIRNLNINAPDKDFVGLFGRIAGGQIKNLRLEDAVIYGHSYVGALAGSNYYGRIELCQVSGAVTGSHLYVGGLVGFNIRGTLITCGAEATVSGNSSVGGLVGENGSGTIINCYAGESVTSEGTSTYSYAGGLVGWNSAGKIQSSYSVANVTATGEDIFVGGITGVLFSGEVTSAYACGDLTSESSSSNYTGGLIGYISDGFVGFSYSTGHVEAAAESGSVGGFVGDMNKGTNAVISCFWDIEYSNLAYSAGGKGLTSQLMKTRSVFQNAGWANQGWLMEDGNGMPRLSWQVAPGVSIPPPLPIPLSGSGTEADPHRIYTVEEFASLSWHFNVLDKHIELMNDLDFSGVDLNPLGDLGPFVGVFDGNGYALQNVKIHQPGSDRIGLFTTLGSGGQIRNIGLINADIQGNDFVGSLVGKNLGGSVSDCYSTGSVTAIGWYAGGLIGYNRSGEISYSYSTSTVIGSEFVGGLAGGFYDGIIISCHASGNVQGSDNVGGLIGDTYDLSITSSHASGNIGGMNHVGGLLGRGWGTLTSSYATGEVNGIEYVGGLVGYSRGTLTACYATGAVSGKDKVGGLVGSSWNWANTITSCFASGNISGEINVGGLVGHNQGTMMASYAVGSVDGINYVGGLVGYQGWGTLTASYATGAVNGIDNIGGLMGYNVGTVSACFWDIQNSGQTDSSGGRGLTTDQMKTLLIFQNAGWSDKGWVMDDGIDCPRLNWENTDGAPIPLQQPIPLDGDGTAENPYVVSTGEDFALLSWYASILDSYIVLKNDMDLVDITLYPIGDFGTFTGVFDGNKKMISNASINQARNNHVGLFGRVGTGAQIFNLTVENINILGHNYVGGLIGDSSGATLYSCHTTGTVNGNNYVGGIVGRGNTISNSSTSGTVNGNNYVGGIAGYSSGWNTMLTSSFATGAVTGTDYVGGLVGQSSNSITSCYAIGSVSGNNYIGGLLGYNNQGKVIQSYATGKILGNEYVGGLCGRVAIGWNYEDTGNFWKRNASEDPNSAAMGTGKTTVEMQTQSTFTDAGWDFVDIWAICEGTNYPRLRWQILSADFVCPDGVHLGDFAHLAGWWLSDDCDLHDDCEGADLDQSGDVEIFDLLILAEQWLR